MNDMAFQSYCITCDKLCSLDSIYCSDKCKLADETQAMSTVESNEGAELVSPLLTPSMYQHQSNYTVLSPLLLSDHQHHYNSKELDDFKLDYVVNTKARPLEDTQQITASSISHNYRKWLTAYK